MPPDRGDLALVARVNRGDAAAFEEIVERYSEWVRLLALRRLGDAAEADDIVQETFFYLFRRFPGFQLTSSLKTLLHVTVDGFCQRRRQRRARSVEFDEEATPSATADTHGDAHDAAKLLDQLTPEQRTLLTLHYTDDLSVPQMSVLLSTPEGTIKSRLARATLALRVVVGVARGKGPG